MNRNESLNLGLQDRLRMKRFKCSRSGGSKRAIEVASGVSTILHISLNFHLSLQTPTGYFMREAYNSNCQLAAGIGSQHDGRVSLLIVWQN